MKSDEIYLCDERRHEEIYTSSRAAMQSCVISGKHEEACLGDFYTAVGISVLQSVATADAFFFLKQNPFI